MEQRGEEGKEVRREKHKRVDVSVDFMSDNNRNKAEEMRQVGEECGEGDDDDGGGDADDGGDGYDDVW